jgi:hypothetical protein
MNAIKAEPTINTSKQSNENELQERIDEREHEILNLKQQNLKMKLEMCEMGMQL